MRDVRTAAPSILVADDDADILDVFVHVLGEAGYATTRAGSVEEVLASIDGETFDLVLTDPFATRASAGPDGKISRLGAVLTIQRHAMPTPVVVCTAWSDMEDDVRQAGFAGFLAKPFDLDVLLTTVAEALRVDLTPTQAKQAALITRFFAALASFDQPALTALCTSDLLYVSPRRLGEQAEAQTHIHGLGAYLAYLAQMRTVFHQPRFEQLRIHAVRQRLAARYRLCWQGQDEVERAVTGCAAFAFAGQRIKQIGVTFNSQQVESLLK